MIKIEQLREQIRVWLHDYESTEEHDNEFCVEMKDEAASLLASVEKLLDETYGK